ncbi:hypothetical protein ACFL0Q_06410 [Thermodesulfobacteriota bacterium]
MRTYSRKTLCLAAMLFLAGVLVLGPSLKAEAQINVVTVDITPLVSPGNSSLGTPTNTMGMALQAVDQGGDFVVAELTPAAFQALTAQQLSAYDLIAINNNPQRIPGGVGTTWHSVVNGRIVLTSHDAPRFKMTFVNPPHTAFGGSNPGPGVEPFGADELVRQAALWAGGVPGKTGLLIFNDAARFVGPVPPGVGGIGWDNPELMLPAAWTISDSDQSGGGFAPGGGYTRILNPLHPIYAGTFPGGVALSDVRFGANSISSFAANIVDSSFHSIFGSFNPVIFTVTEDLINAGINDPGNYLIAEDVSAPGPDGSAITLIRETIPDYVDIKPQSCPNPLNPKSQGSIPVAIVGTPGFDVTLIDVSTVLLEGVVPIIEGSDHILDVATPFDEVQEDCDDCSTEGCDYIPDLVVKFDTQEVIAALESSHGPLENGDCLEVKITASLVDGAPFSGSDLVIIRNRGRGQNN